MILKYAKRIIFFPLILIGISAVAWVSWKFSTGAFEIVNRDEITRSFSDFLTLNGTDEYVIAQLSTTETQSKQVYKKVMGYPVGDTTATISIKATYSYHVKLAELTHELKDHRVIITVPNLYLSTPVNIDLASLNEEGKTFGFGENKNEILSQMRQELTEELRHKGKVYKHTAYDKAAKALADNFNLYFINHGFGGLYNEIVIVFEDEKSTSQRKYEYSNPLCQPEPCLLQWEINKKHIFKAQ